MQGIPTESKLKPVAFKMLLIFLQPLAAAPDISHVWSEVWPKARNYKKVRDCRQPVAVEKNVRRKGEAGGRSRKLWQTSIKTR